MKKKSKKGFTLVELLVTISLLTLVAGMCATFVIIGMKNAKENAKQTSFLNGANLLIATLNSDIAKSENGKIVVNASDSGNKRVLVVLYDRGESITGATTSNSDSTIEVMHTYTLHAFAFEYSSQTDYDHDSKKNVKFYSYSIDSYPSATNSTMSTEANRIRNTLNTADDAGEIICSYVKDASFTMTSGGTSFDVALQCEDDDSWLETSFYVR